MSLDLTEPQRRELHTLVGGIAERHIDRIVKRMWMSVLTLGVIVLIQGFYIAYVSGTKVEEIDYDHRSVLQLQQARGNDEVSLAAIAATQNGMNQNIQLMEAQLNRIERNTKP